MASLLAWALVRGGVRGHHRQGGVLAEEEGKAVVLGASPVAGEVGEKRPLLRGEEALGVEPPREGVKGAAEAIHRGEGHDPKALLQEVARKAHPALHPARHGPRARPHAPLGHLASCGETGSIPRLRARGPEGLPRPRS